MSKVKGLKCCSCNKEFALGEIEYICPDCGSNTEVLYNYDEIKSNLNRDILVNNHNYDLWRYFSVLPVFNKDNIPPIHIGWTPLYKPELLNNQLGLSNLYLKDDGRNASGSLKDRAGSIALMRALEIGSDIICGASTGNAASSLSCLTASICFPTIIFVPETAPKAKIAQLLTFGAKVIMVKGSYDQAFDLCLEVSDKYGWYNRNTGYNPFTREGKKTCSFEIVEQLGFQVPDKVFVSVGDGNIISGVWKGFKDFKELGIIDKLPQIIAVQSSQSSAVVDAINENDGIIKAVNATTVADSISVDLPRDGDMAVKAVQESDGFAIKVDDSEILECIKTVARGSGVFGEPAGVTSVAGLIAAKEKQLIDKDEKIVCIITGNGLKDIDSAIKVAGNPFLIEPELNAVDNIISEIK